MTCPYRMWVARAIDSGDGGRAAHRYPRPGLSPTTVSKTFMSKTFLYLYLQGETFPFYLQYKYRKSFSPQDRRTGRENLRNHPNETFFYAVVLLCCDFHLETAGQEGRISETTQMKLSFMLSCMLSFLSFSPMSLNGKILILYLQGGEVYTSISPSLSTRVFHPHVEIFFPIMILAPCSTKNILTAQVHEYLTLIVHICILTSLDFQAGLVATERDQK